MPIDKSSKAIPERSSTLRLLTHENFPGYIAEVFRSLRTKVLLSLADLPFKTVAITSLESGAGKSTISANLAVSIAKREVKVLLIDGDLRRGEMGPALGYNEGEGLTELLESAMPITERYLASFLREGPVPFLKFIPSGRKIPHSPELLSSPRLRTAINRFSQDFEVILLDLPPIGMAIDPVVVHDIVMRYILVAKAGSTNISDLVQKVEEHPQVYPKVMGLILNKSQIDRKMRYYKYSKYYITPER